MKLSIILVSWNTRDYLLGALRSIYKNPPSCDLEVIVVDNASEDGTAQAVAREFPGATLIANERNVGYAEGNNQGLALASGDFLLLLNPDVLVHPRTLDRAIAHLQQHPDAAAVGARQLNPDGSVQPSLRGFPTPLAVFFEAAGLSRLFPRSRLFGAYRMTWFGYDREADVDQPMGTFLLIRREALEAVGTLDERFPIFFNEVDWCFRARRAGWRIRFSPDIVITHFGGGSTRQVPAAMAWESRRGLLTYYRKHYPSPLFAPIYWAVAAASWLQARHVARTRSARSANG